jgi:hypothetical protein
MTVVVVLIVAGFALILLGVVGITYDLGVARGVRVGRRQAGEEFRQANVIPVTDAAPLAPGDLVSIAGEYRRVFDPTVAPPDPIVARAAADLALRRRWHLQGDHNQPFESCASDICRAARPVPHG